MYKHAVWLLVFIHVGSCNQEDIFKVYLQQLVGVTFRCWIMLSRHKSSDMHVVYEWPIWHKGGSQDSTVCIWEAHMAILIWAIANAYGR